MSYRHLIWTTGCLAGIVACGGSAGTADGGGDVDAGLVDFAGTMVVTYHHGSSSTLVPIDLSETTVRAWIEGADGYPSVDGRGEADGTFVITGLPGGDRLVQIGDWYFDTGSDTLDAGWDRVGRPEAGIAGGGTRISLSVTGLQSWQDGDGLRFDVPQSGAAVWDLESFASNPPMLSDEQLSNMTFDWQGNELISTSGGDGPVLVQTSTVFDLAEATLSIPVRRLEVADLEQLDGQTAAVTGAFSVVPATESTMLNWRGSEILALATDVHPTAEADFLGFFSILALPPAVPPWPLLGKEALLAARVWAPGSDLDFGAFAHPVASDGESLVGMFASFAFDTTHQLPGSASTWRTRYWLNITDLPQAESEGIGPLVSPPRDVRVEGASTTSDLTGVTTTPLLSWSAPRVGTAHQYAVEVVEVFDDLGETSLSAVAYLFLSDTAVRLPPGILMPGHTYLFVIEARHCPGIEVEQSPLRFAIPYGKVPAVTALVTP